MTRRTGAIRSGTTSSSRTDVGDGIRPAASYGVASESSAVAGRHEAYGGTRRVVRRPAGRVHALVGDGTVLCGVEVDALLLWPGWTFGDIEDPDRCPECAAIAA